MISGFSAIGDSVVSWCSMQEDFIINEFKLCMILKWRIAECQPPVRSLGFIKISLPIQQMRKRCCHPVTALNKVPECQSGTPFATLYCADLCYTGLIRRLSQIFSSATLQPPTKLRGMETEQRLLWSQSCFCWLLPFQQSLERERLVENICDYFVCIMQLLCKIFATYPQVPRLVDGGVTSRNARRSFIPPVYFFFF